MSEERDYTHPKYRQMLNAMWSDGGGWLADWDPEAWAYDYRQKNGLPEPGPGEVDWCARFMAMRINLMLMADETAPAYPRYLEWLAWMGDRAAQKLHAANEKLAEQTEAEQHQHDVSVLPINWQKLAESFAQDDWEDD